jgi:hypothetical protein
LLAREELLLQISLHGAALPPDTLLRFSAAMRALKSLDVRGLDIDDDTITELATFLPSLRELSISGARAEEKRATSSTWRLGAISFLSMGC